MDRPSSVENRIHNYSLFTEELDELPVLSKTLINTINQYSFCMAGKDVVFREALLGSDVLLPDGIGIVAAVRFLTGKKIKKIAGADLHLHLLAELNKSGGRCFYLGSSEKILKLIYARVNKEYPAVKVGFFSPPFKKKFSAEENDKMVQAVNAFHADVLFIGLTAPKQEKWAFLHKDLLDVRMICSIGAVFDFYAGTIQRPGTGWIHLGLEWFIRLVAEPRRMWKRYLFYGPIFIKDIMLEKGRTLINLKSSPSRTGNRHKQTA